MYEDIRKNKLKTGIIISLFIIIITLIIYYICVAFNMGSISIIIALLFSLSSFSSYYYSDKVVLAMNHARPATKEENLKLNNILEALIVSSGLQYTPKLYIIDDAQPNAFATGRNPKNSVICVTTALLEKLNYYELEGVIAHELGHIRNYDIRLSAVITVMIGLIVMLSDYGTRALYWRGRDSDDNSKSSGFMMLAGLIFLILGPIFAKLMQLAISRKREYLADATAVEFTRNPDGLINALRKLDSDKNELEHVSNSTSHMYIIDPFKKNIGSSYKKTSSLLCTHPSIEDRIHALENLK